MRGLLRQFPLALALVNARRLNCIFDSYKDTALQRSVHHYRSMFTAKVAKLQKMYSITCKTEGT